MNLFKTASYAETKKMVIDPSPKTVLLYGAQKLGKSYICSNIGRDKKLSDEERFNRNLIIDLDKGAGYDQYLPWSPQVFPISDINDFGKLYKAIKNYQEQIKNGGITPDNKPFDHIVIDTLTFLETFCMEAIVSKYNKMLGAGTYDNVGEIGKDNATKGCNGWIEREEMAFQIIETLKKISNRLIIIGHYKEEFKIEDGIAVQVEAKDINLSGKFKDRLSASMDATGFIYRGPVAEEKENDVYVNFTSKNTRDGSRCPHLSGKVVMLSSKTGEGPHDIEVYWDNIFLPKSEWEKYSRK